jgi:hypothetical protein
MLIRNKPDLALAASALVKRLVTSGRDPSWQSLGMMQGILIPPSFGDAALEDYGTSSDNVRPHMRM